MSVSVSPESMEVVSLSFLVPIIDMIDVFLLHHGCRLLLNHIKVLCASY